MKSDFLSGPEYAALRVIAVMLRTRLEAAVAEADAGQRALLARLRARIRTDGNAMTGIGGLWAGRRPANPVTDADLIWLMAVHAALSPISAELLSGRERMRDNATWRALDDCTLSLLARPVDLRAAIRHARGGGS